MNCQFCGDKIPIFRRLGNEQFCSEEHRREYAVRLSEQGLALLLDRPSPAKFTAVEVLEPPRPKRRGRSPKPVPVNGDGPAPSPFLFERPEGWENGCGHSRAADAGIFAEYRVYPNGLALARGGARAARPLPLRPSVRFVPGQPDAAGPVPAPYRMLPGSAGGTAARGFRAGRALRLGGRMVPERGWLVPMSVMEPRWRAGQLALGPACLQCAAWDGELLWASGRITEPAGAAPLVCTARAGAAVHANERARPALALPGIATSYLNLRGPRCEPRRWPVLAGSRDVAAGACDPPCVPLAAATRIGFRLTLSMPAIGLPSGSPLRASGFQAAAAQPQPGCGMTAVFAWPMAWRNATALRTRFPLPPGPAVSAMAAPKWLSPVAAAALQASVAAPVQFVLNPVRTPPEQTVSSAGGLSGAGLRALVGGVCPPPGPLRLAPPGPSRLEAYVALPATRYDARQRTARLGPILPLATPRPATVDALSAEAAMAPVAMFAARLADPAPPGAPGFRTASPARAGGWPLQMEVRSAGPLSAPRRAWPVSPWRSIRTLRPAGLRGLYPAPAAARPAPAEPVQQFHLLPEVSEAMNRVKPRRAPGSAWRSRLLARLGGQDGPLSQALAGIGRLWSLPPAFARGLALALPLMMVPTLFYMTGGTRVSAGSAWQNLQESIRDRATIEFEDDFRAGLDGWIGEAGWQQTWTFDQASFVLPGRLALFNRSLPLDNYRMEFVGQIERRGMAFVVRARDTANYHAVKFVIVAPGPLPRANIVRYTVVGGVEGPRTELPLPLAIRNDTLYRVVVTAQGDRFTTSVNGQLVDQWADDRLATGGVGFFSDRDSAFRLRSVRVVDKDDFLGWVCSQISPRTADSKATGEKKQ